ncbi:hypothetical protein C0991_004358 [Blastosporella zonata]|nr:hypothetical protein C0991_004358 [Blastosporella zonata]
MDPNEVDVVDELTKRKRTVATDNPLMWWSQDIDLYLRELLRLDAPANINLTCLSCQVNHTTTISTNNLMLKRAGRGHHESGAGGTAAGECAVVCPACPTPSVNLPLDWESAPPHQAWLYTLFVGIDANFRLKRLSSSTLAKDPGLNHGYSYFVEDVTFKQYLDQFGNIIKDDVSTCTNHDAIKLASSRGGKGIDASGVGKTECARHNMKRPLSMGDLQKGER